MLGGRYSDELGVALTHAGWLEKQGGDFIALWRRRHFLLRGRHLLYASSAGGRILGCIDVPGTVVRRTEPRGGLAISGAHLPRTYQLAAETEDEADLWMRRLAESGAVRADPEAQGAGRVPDPRGLRLRLQAQEATDRAELDLLWHTRFAALRKVHTQSVASGQRGMALPYAQGPVTSVRAAMVLGELAQARSGAPAAGGAAVAAGGAGGGGNAAQQRPPSPRASARPQWPRLHSAALGDVEPQSCVSTPRCATPLGSPLGSAWGATSAGGLARFNSFRSCCGESDEDEPAGGDGVLITAARAAHARGALPPPQLPAPPQPGAAPGQPTAVFDTQSVGPTRELPPHLAQQLPIGRIVDSRVMPRWDFLSDEGDLEYLAQGGSLFACCPSPGSVLQDVERAMIATFIDFTSFADELRDNGVEKVDMGNMADLADHIFLLSKAQYLLPPQADLEQFTPANYASTVFQKAVAPSGVKVFPSSQIKDRDGRPYRKDDTFCVKKEVLAWVFSITTQFKVSVLSEQQLQSVRALADGLTLARGLLLERTKQDRGQDATKKAKQVFLLHRLGGGGLLVTHVCFSIFTHLPSVAQKLINKIGDRGGAETSETAHRMRVFLSK